MPELNSNPTDWHDRLIDAALDEVAGGQSPPDLTSNIYARVAVDGAQPASLATKELVMATPENRYSLRNWVLVASVLVNLGLAGVLMSGGDAVSVARNSDDITRESEATSIPSAEELELPGMVESTVEPKTWSGESISDGSEDTPDTTIYFGFADSLSEIDPPAESVAAPMGDDFKPLGEKFTGERNSRPMAGSDGLDNGIVAGHRFQVGTPGLINDAYAFSSLDRRQGQLGYLSQGERLERQRSATKGIVAGGIGPGQGGDQYSRIVENPFIPAIGGNAVSTFSIDVDTASYANVRQFLLDSGSLPPPDAVRIEELVNYFHYDYAGPASESEDPFAAHVEVAGCPWQPKHRLVRIGIKGREIDPAKRPKSNLVFLIDVSGSMSEQNKLPLVVHGMKQLARQLGENDRVAIVVYASSEGLVLESTPGDNQAAIVGSLERLNAGGSTAGGAGINLAYQIAEENFIEGGTNRVILCTDGDFNVGTTSTADLERIVEQKAKDTRVFLSVIGFGRGNLNDEMMEKISGIGNGNYYYVDGDAEAERVFVRGMTGMLVTIAKDVKIQVEFNPAEVAGYRLLGYENRMLRTEDFNDDTKDAGEIGSGHTVTALYQVVPAGKPVDSPEVDPLKYQRETLENETAQESGELLTLKMRYKQPDGETSVKREWPAKDSGKSFKEADADMQFASAVAGFGMLLRDSRYRGDATFAAMREIAGSSLGSDPNGERSEFLQLVTRGLELKGEPPLREQAVGGEQPAASE